VSKNTQIRLATEEDLLRDFGRGGFMIGIPVRPKLENEQDDPDDDPDREDGDD
jgi:hypothetical protein